MYLKEFFEALSKQVVPTVVDEAKKSGKEILQYACEAWEEFKKGIESTPGSNFVYKNIEILDMPTLLNISKENLVEEADEIYVWKKKTDNSFLVYLTYGKNREMFDQKENKFVIIEAATLEAEVLKLFSESDVVILK